MVKGKRRGHRKEKRKWMIKEEGTQRKKNKNGDRRRKGRNKGEKEMGGVEGGRERTRHKLDLPR